MPTEAFKILTLVVVNFLLRSPHFGCRKKLLKITVQRQFSVTVFMVLVGFPKTYSDSKLPL
jgi:hypothetical protein